MMKYVAMLGPYFAGFGAERRGHRPAPKSTLSLFKCDKYTKKRKHGSFCGILITSSSCVLPWCSPNFVGGGR